MSTDDITNQQLKDAEFELRSEWANKVHAVKRKGLWLRELYWAFMHEPTEENAEKVDKGMREYIEIDEDSLFTDYMRQWLKELSAERVTSPEKEAERKLAEAEIRLRRAEYALGDLKRKSVAEKRKSVADLKRKAKRKK